MKISVDSAIHCGKPLSYKYSHWNLAISLPPPKTLSFSPLPSVHLHLRHGTIPDGARANARACHQRPLAEFRHAELIRLEERRALLEDLLLLDLLLAQRLPRFAAEVESRHGDALPHARVDGDGDELDGDVVRGAQDGAVALELRELPRLDVAQDQDDAPLQFPRRHDRAQSRRDLARLVLADVDVHAEELVVLLVVGDVAYAPHAYLEGGDGGRTLLGERLGRLLEGIGEAEFGGRPGRRDGGGGANLGLLCHVGVAVLLLEAELHSSVSFTSRDDAIRSTIVLLLPRAVICVELAASLMNFTRSERARCYGTIGFRLAQLCGEEKSIGKVGQNMI